MASRAKVPIFTDTSLGTRIAIDVYPNITAADFKREIERAHLNCFPMVGQIRVNGLMVKRKSHFYHLPDSFPIKYAFHGSKGTWFIHTEACSQSCSDRSYLSECLPAEIRCQTSYSSNVTDPLKPKNSVSGAKKKNVYRTGKKRGIRRIPHFKVLPRMIPRTINLSKRKKRKRVKKNHFVHRTAKQSELFASRSTDGECIEEWKSSETLSEAVSVSVSGIIKKYFSDYEEVNLSLCKEQLMTQTVDNCMEPKVSPMLQFTPKTRPRILPFPLLTDLSSKYVRYKFERTEVGKRLIMASNNLGISASMEKSASGVRRVGDRKLSVPESCSLVRSIVFEISDSDE